MYSGRSPMLQHMALDLLAAADRFQLCGLKDMADQVSDFSRITRNNSIVLNRIFTEFSSNVAFSI